MNATLPELPTVAKSPEKFLPTIIQDTREQEPLFFETLPVIEGTLSTGDYSVVGLENDFAVERKSLPDLFGSLTSGRDRFMREIQRLNGFTFRRLLIIGSEHEIEQGQHRSRVSPKSVLHSLAAIEARGVPVVFSASPARAAAQIEKWAFWRAREVLKIASGMMV